MNRYKYVFVVVLYKNMKDIEELRESIAEKIHYSYRIVLVNNYADEQSLEQARNLERKFEECVLIEKENNGYGAGNNAGVSYATQNFCFDYLIICNADTVIESFDECAFLSADVPAIYAPDITCATGKHQNPNWVCKSDLIEWMQYVACKNENMFLDYGSIGILKLQRILYQKVFHNAIRKKIYSAHGAFLILSESAVEKLAPLYDENMFLFYEEVYLANRARKYNVETFYTPKIKIYHKEDGSMRISNINQRKVSHTSVVYYYEHKKV